MTFGDPFNGSPIKGYKGPIEIYCAPGDGVCTGNFELVGAHLSYVTDGTIASAKKRLLELANGQGDDKCCHPKAVPAPPTPEQWASTIKLNGGKIPVAPKGTTVDQWAEAISKSAGGLPKVG
jgi:hypothetical protein